MAELDTLIATLDEKVLGEFAERLNEKLCDKQAPCIRHLDLFVTHRCNLRCDYCFLEGLQRQGDMPFEVAEAAVKLLIKLSRKHNELRVTLFGGEPLLCKDRMEEILAMAFGLCQAHGKHLNISCTTNGLMLDEQAIEISKKYGFLYLLSLDGIPSVHDRHRKTAAGEGTFDKLLEKIQFLKSHQGWLGARVTIMPDSIASLATGVRELFDLGINQFIIGLVMEAEWRPEQLRQIKEQYYEIFSFYHATLEKGLPIRISALEKNFFNPGMKDQWGCYAGSGSLAIDAFGNIYPCSRFVCKEQYRMGNIMQGSINWQFGKQISDQRPEIRWKCLHCDYKDYCSGGCYESNRIASGSPYYPSDCLCMEVQAVHEIVQENPHFQSLFTSVQESNSVADRSDDEKFRHIHAL